MSFDVVIIGAGPAGALLAYELAVQNIKTLLIEKEHLPRYKACGGGLPIKSVNLLPFDASSTFEKYADRGILNFNGTPILDLDLDSTFAWLVMRARFDHFLVEQAVRAGAQLMDEAAFESFEALDGSARIVTSRGVFTAALLVGADGVNSRVARQSHLMENRQTGVGLEAELEVDEQALLQQGSAATFDFGVLANGYGWIFPKKSHLSAGIFQAKPSRAPFLKQRLTAFFESQPLLKNPRVIKSQGHLIPLGGKKTLLHKDHVILLGDAASLVDPWLGEGIYYALHSAKIAAQIIPMALAHGLKHLAAYTRQVNRQIVNDLGYARMFANWVYRFPYFMSKALGDSAILQKNIFGVIRGDVNFARLGRNIMLKLPIILAHVISKGERGP